MYTPNLFIFSVKNPLASAVFYERLLGTKPVASAPTFVSFELGSGFLLGLWGEASSDIVMSGTGNRCELAFTVADRAAVEAAYADWQKRGVNIVEPLHVAPFGPTFTGIDPDGHRLRVCVPDE
jgi:hypothetical protein